MRSRYYEHKAREREPDRLPDRTKRDRALEYDIQRVWENNFKVYGANKVWRQLLREDIRVARCTVERLMKRLGIQGIRRGKKCWTTIADDLLDRPTDKVNRQFAATRPNQLWVADITFVATWVGFVYVAFLRMFLLGALLAGGSVGHCIQIWREQHWSRRCGHGGKPAG